MNSKISKYEFGMLNILLYLISPIISLPTILLGLVKRRLISYIVYALFIAFISYMFIPTIEMDKSRHFEFYQYIKHFSLQEFFIYNFKDSPDFLFRLFLYLGSVIGISFHHIIFFVTFLTVYLIFLTYYKYIKNSGLSKRYNIIIAFLIIFSLSYIDIISGLRYTLALALVFYGFYIGIKSHKKMGFIFIFLGLLTHFGIISFLLLYLIYPLLDKIHIKKLKILLLISVFFVLIPQSLMLEIFQSLGISKAIDTKANAYLGGNDIENTKDTFSTLFIKFFNIIWVILISLYILIKNASKTESIYYKILIYLLIFTNVFISIPIIFNRYALFIKLFLVLFLLDNELKKNNIKITLVFLFIFFVISFNQFIVMRVGFDFLFHPSVEDWSFLHIITNEPFRYLDIK